MASDIVLYMRILPRGVTYGDVVILEDAEGKEIIKRIAGLPGDAIEVYDTGRYLRNGSPVAEQDIIYSTVGTGAVQYFTVPEGSYFYLGDNRPISMDSRQRGSIAKENIRGRVLLTLRG